MSCSRKVGKVGRGGGQVVSMFAFYSNDPSSNPAEVYSFFLRPIEIKVGKMVLSSFGKIKI